MKKIKIIITDYVLPAAIGLGVLIALLYPWPNPSEQQRAYCVSMLAMSAIGYMSSVTVAAYARSLEPIITYIREERDERLRSVYEYELREQYCSAVRYGLSAALYDTLAVCGMMAILPWGIIGLIAYGFTLLKEDAIRKICAALSPESESRAENEELWYKAIQVSVETLMIITAVSS